MSEVVASNPPTFTCAPCPNKTPLELSSQILPFASIWPSITEAFGPVTRLTVSELAVGWLKTTDEPLGIEKLFQLISALLLDWSTTVLLAFGVEIVALPTATDPPLGPPARATGETSRAVATSALVASSLPFSNPDVARFMLALPVKMLSQGRQAPCSLSCHCRCPERRAACARPQRPDRCCRETRTSDRCPSMRWTHLPAEAPPSADDPCSTLSPHRRKRKVRNSSPRCRSGACRNEVRTIPPARCRPQSHRARNRAQSACRRTGFVRPLSAVELHVVHCSS